MARIPILGVVLAGGQSTRFGSDKALAKIGGRSLIALAVEQLSGWCDHVVIVGREAGPAPCLPDWPRPGMGPLGGLAAALHYAVDESYGEVISCGVDSPGLPADLPDLLFPAPACIDQQPVIGRWPAAEGARAIEAILRGTGRHSMFAFAESLGARRIVLPATPVNINRPEDLSPSP